MEYSFATGGTATNSLATTPGEQSIFVRTINLYTVLGPDVHTRVLGQGRCASTSTLTGRRSLASVLFVL
ncbi:hypothetical protein NCS56_01183700 [Fusarium sp. Ph1]|nr:hypothetical protein NCS56_01183700 [Fusarium sp. Ph1]